MNQKANPNTLMHTGALPYAIELEQAAPDVRAKFQSILDRGQSQGLGLLQHITRSVPRDALVSTRAMSFRHDTERGLLLDVEDGDGKRTSTLHRNAIQLLAGWSRNVVGVRNIDAMLDQGQWGRELVTHILGQVFSNIERERVLLRNVEEQTRAVLSDKYLIINEAEVLTEILHAITEMGIVITASRTTDLEWSVDLLHPHVLEPTPNEPVLYGVRISNSNFGRGPLKVSALLERMFCTNKMTRKEHFRRNHIGPRLPDDFQFAQETLEANAKLKGLVARDVLRSALSPKAVEEEMRLIAAAHEHKVDVKKVLGGLVKGSKITKSESKDLAELYNTGGIEDLPPASGGDSMWRLANAFTALARETSPEKAWDLEQIGGDLLQRSAKFMTSEEKAGAIDAGAAGLLTT